MALRLRRSLVLFHLFLLGGVLLLNLLCLLSVLLLHLLFLRIVVVFRCGLLVIFFLLLLEFLVILGLLGGQLVLLLLIFLVGCGVASVWRCSFVRLQFARVIVGTGLSFISRTRFISGRSLRGRSLVFASCLLGGYNASFEVTGFGSCRDGRPSLVSGGTQFGITPGFLDVLRLRRYRADMVFVSIRLFL